MSRSNSLLTLKPGARHFKGRIGEMSFVDACAYAGFPTVVELPPPGSTITLTYDPKLAARELILEEEGE